MKVNLLTITFTVLLTTCLLSYSTSKKIIFNKPIDEIGEFDWKQEEYKYLSYDEMRARMYNLKKLYPHIMKIETADQKFGIPHLVSCGNETCMLDIVTITDFQAQDNGEKVQVYISGALHGDEVVGPNVAYYLMEYLVSNYKVDQQVTALLQNREIIITPMTNAVGYYHYEREERVNTSHGEYLMNPNKKRNVKSFDINRDFPYNTQKHQCLNTIAGRVVHQLFVENLIVSALTFHGGINVIGYPWGSYNRVNFLRYEDEKGPLGSNYISKEAPDFQAFESMGWIMKNETGTFISRKQDKSKILEYHFGDISSKIYPVSGGLEDWGYGAGWDRENEEATVFQCEPQSYLLKNVTQSPEAYENVRSAVYIIETDVSKKPAENLLGSRMVSRQRDGKMRILRKSIDEIDGEHDGHINRNLRLTLAFIDLSKPYIHVKSYEEGQDGQVEITWQVNGCHTLNEARAIVNGMSIDFMKDGETGTCNYLMGRDRNQTTFTIKINKDDNVVFEAVTDQHFGKSVNASDVSPPGFANNPQLHLSKLRLLDSYEAKSKSKVLRGSKYIRLTKEQCKQQSKLIQPQLRADLQQRQLALRDENAFQKPYDNRESLSVVLTPIIDQKITGIMKLVDDENRGFNINGQLTNLPLMEEIEVKIMEYGDLSSLAVEYPDYNSLGQPLIPILNTTTTLTTTEVFKFSKNIPYPRDITKLSDLAGRALIITKRHDLIAYGIMVNESSISHLPPQTSKKSAKSVALCENYRSTIQYRAIFNLNQVDDEVSFSGLLRTSTQLEDEDELIVSLNYRESFDLDLENAYPSDKDETFFQWMHPCYVIEEESVDDQDWILGRSLQMYGQHEEYSGKILETSKCHIGLQNPNFRISDERFCATSLESSYIYGGERKYTQNALINFFLIGFLCGCILAFCLYMSTKLTFKSEEDIQNERMETAAKMQFVELTDISSANDSFRKNEFKLDHEEL